MLTVFLRFCSPKHEAFMIGTAKNPNNKGFDLFITTAPIPDLNDKLVVFGRVIKGEDIVQVLSEFLFLGAFFRNVCLNH